MLNIAEMLSNQFISKLLLLNNLEADLVDMHNARWHRWSKTSLDKSLKLKPSRFVQFEIKIFSKIYISRYFIMLANDSNRAMISNISLIYAPK